MSKIYGYEDQVWVWLGEGNESNDMAIKFIKDEVLQIMNFDKLCERPKASEKLAALGDLMQRDWIFRQWVVQEIVLETKPYIYCGKKFIRWNYFAVAIELFVAAETRTHGLSEVMRHDPQFLVPGWFDYVLRSGSMSVGESN